MINYTARAFFLMAIVFLNNDPSYGQVKIDTIVLQKGEVLDLLLLSQNPGVEADLKSYFRTALPVAKRMSYQALPGFKTIGHTRGNLSPSRLLLGKWNSLSSRENFIAHIGTEVPDFDQRRRTIWSFFGMRYYEMKEDLSFNIDREKYHVGTAYWIDQDHESKAYYKIWKAQVKTTGGQIIIQLENGKSPSGYVYNPDLFVITSWQNERAFELFQKEIEAMKPNGVHKVNEFVLK